MPKKLSTRLAHAGRSGGDPQLPNPPLERASTVLIGKAANLYDWDRKVYGRFGLGTQAALAGALKEIYAGAAWCGLAGSGLSACVHAIQAFARTGAHMLVVDSVYGPVRGFAKEELARQGVEIEFYDPRIGGDIARLIRDDTALVYLESPGSLTIEVQDVPAICEAARARGVPTAIDDTWSAGVLCDVFALGCDVAIQAVTKYGAGHSDVLLGAVLARDGAISGRIGDTLRRYGVMADPDSAWLALRGLRTLPTRLAQQEAAGIALARWLQPRPEVARVIHPGLESHPDHALWKRDFSGASGLFSFELKGDAAAATRFLDALDLFGLGFSWGGYESLAVVCNPQLRRDAVAWDGAGQLIRLSIGLEDPEDLAADLAQALEAAAGQGG